MIDEIAGQWYVACRVLTDKYQFLTIKIDEIFNKKN